MDNFVRSQSFLFCIERRFDGNNFDSIGRVNAKAGGGTGFIMSSMMMHIRRVLLLSAEARWS